MKAMNMHKCFILVFMLQEEPKKSTINSYLLEHQCQNKYGQCICDIIPEDKIIREKKKLKSKGIVGLVQFKIK